MASGFRRALLILSQVVWVHTAWAADWTVDWTPDTTRILGDPAFMPLGGQIAGSFTYTYSVEPYDYAPGPAASISAWNQTTNTFVPSLSYGITDDISISANLGWGNARAEDSYIYDRVVVTNPAPTLHGGISSTPTFSLVPTQEHASFLFQGPSDPGFNVTWRAIDQRSAPVSVDLTAGYAPDIFPARDPATDSTGTMALGGQRASLQASVSRETRFFTALGYVTFGYDGRRDVGQGGGNVVLRYDSHPDFAIGVETETRFTPWLALNTGVSAQKSASFGLRSIPGASAPETVQPGGAISPYVGLVVPLLDHRVAVALIYQHDFFGDEKITSAYAATQRYYNQQSDMIVARLSFVFGVR